MKIKDILKNTAQRLARAGIESATLDSRLLLCKYLGVDKVYLIVNSEKEIHIDKGYESLVARRESHEPMQYVLNNAEFMGMDFYVDENVLIPRADTEILVEIIIDFIGDKNIDFLEIGTGSGCIPISILANCKNSTATAVDISKKALDVARKNAEINNVSSRITFVNEDILKFFPNRKVDCIVSNPPYIERDVIPSLMKGVREFEPEIALDGGVDGLDFYRRIADKGYEILNKGGLIAFEIGYNQGTSAREILINKGYTNVKVTKDLAQNDRVVTGTK